MVQRTAGNVYRLKYCRLTSLKGPDTTVRSIQVSLLSGVHDVAFIGESFQLSNKYPSRLSKEDCNSPGLDPPIVTWNGILSSTFNFCSLGTESHLIDQTEASARYHGRTQSSKKISHDAFNSSRLETAETPWSMIVDSCLSGPLL